MSELSPTAREIVDAARGGYDPTAGDRERVRMRLSAAILGGQLPSAATGAKIASGSAMAPAAAITLKAVAASLLVAGGVVGITLATSSRHDRGLDNGQRPAVRPAAVLAHAAPATDRRVLPVPIEAPAPVAVGPHQPRNRRPSAVRAFGEGTLAAETRLLQAAQQALRDQAREGALAIAEEHAARFPHGVLAPEREAVRAIALCELVMFDAGRAVARHFLEAHDGSPLAGRVRKACAMASDPRP